MRFKLLGVNVDSLSEAEIHERTAKLSIEKRTSQIILLDTYLLMKAQFSKELKNIINSCDMVIPISGGIKFGLKFFKVKLDNVYNFFSFIIRLVTYLTEYNKNIYLLGGTERSIVRAEKNIRGSFPGIRLMGRFHVKYRKEFESNLI
ncbi:MAG: WecB/TagA/CpsF family glycosyltransferase, partial [Spirochaetes bacterium]|nr:WecB/TagA/CpsF family glycosyltransferase [Spirochaetota bacterium]